MKQILFNHIPKTGGTTLRIILNKVYGNNNVFFINSKDIPASYKKFKSLSTDVRNGYSVISGHGSEFFSVLMATPFRICLLREPKSLFISQYNYLRQSKNSNFLNEVSTLNSFDEYIDYAIKSGQDNLLTRYLSKSNSWLVHAQDAIPSMENEGDGLLDAAKKELHGYDFLTDLENFDAGIYCLSKNLGWKSIPNYRPSNVTIKDSTMAILTDADTHRLNKVLSWDIELYEYFKNNALDSTVSASHKGIGYNLIILKQRLINLLAGVMAKR